jgi:hypothetical protein
MPHCGPLYWYGLFVICLTSWLIVVPFLRGKSELLSAWNMLLGGLALFIGFGSLEAAFSPTRFRGLQWFEPTAQQVTTYMVYSTVFLASLLFFYYFDPFSKSVASRCFNKWPPISTGMMLFISAACLVLAVAARIPMLQRITFVGVALTNVSHKAMLFACVFSFVLWYRQRTNIAWLALFLAVFLGMGTLAMVASGGRRLLMSVFLVPVLVIYYYQARNWRPTKSLTLVGVGAMCILLVGIVYATIRHFDRRGEKTERTTSAVVERVKGADITYAVQKFTSDILFAFGQQNVHYAMLIDELLKDGRIEDKPFNTFKFMASYPVPRRVWQDKPLPLGRFVGTDIVPMFAKNQGVRWGCGISGQALYEGGLPMILLFAYLATFCVRLLDDPLRRQPTNPFLLAMLAAASFHVVAWPRGDLGVLSIEIIECFVFTFALAISCRFLFGTNQAYVVSASKRAGTYYAMRVPRY